MNRETFETLWPRNVAWDNAYVRRVSISVSARSKLPSSYRYQGRACLKWRLPSGVLRASSFVVLEGYIDGQCHGCLAMKKQSLLMVHCFAQLRVCPRKISNRF